MVRVNKFAMLGFAAAIALGMPALADAVAERGPNGGMLSEVGEHHIELIVSGQALTVHLLDHKNKAVAEAGLTGTAVITAGGTTETVKLTDQCGGKLSGSGKFPATGALQVVVNVNAPNEPTLTAKFDVKR